MNDSKPTVDTTSSKSIQFRLSTIFAVTSVATILAAYLRPRGDDPLLAILVEVIQSA